MQKFELLIEKIKKCNLSKEDKKTLIEILENKNPDLDHFINTFITLCKLSTEMLKFFDLDVG